VPKAIRNTYYCYGKRLRRLIAGLTPLRRGVDHRAVTRGLVAEKETLVQLLVECVGPLLSTISPLKFHYHIHSQHIDARSL